MIPACRFAKTNWLAIFALATLVALIFAVVWLPPAGHAAPVVQIDAAALFQQRCGPCHGPEGQGTQFAPALTRLGDHSDDELVKLISEGKPGTAMLAWNTILSPEEIRTLVPYLRSLRGAASPPPAPTTVPAPNPAVEPRLAIILDLSPSTAGVVIVRAAVRNPEGQPVYDVPVTFDLVTSLGGRLEVGAAKTDSLGHALIEYTAGEGRTITLEATAGQGAQAGTTSGTTITSGTVDWAPAPLISPNPPVAEVAVLVVILGGVWLTYGYIGRQLIGIAREE